MIYTFEGHTPRIDPSAYIAPEATIIGNVVIGAGVSVWPGAVIRGDVGAIRIGARSNIQDGAVVHVDTGGETILGEDVTVGHLAMVHGCHVEPASLIGMNSTVLSRSRIGECTIVGGGAVVLEGQVVPPFSVAAGVPAKVRKELPGSSRTDRIAHAAHYVELGRRHREGLAQHEV
ncbi:gamma carbonic anhydrase family protein [Corynebacterium liangguodongii]|uniref:Gamma carbonic anhydrase family protein n=1 Tax=Corynebacterium liangguodongii TaxID=2079535 RepID=A0A2S0WBJ3_9CORY|nr:gamma carbonic anhydrase family protein [Corynebacterium liangguodongii]AWB83131.1 gamma carbonic anhydrase family protein [Corynebacterium liangguodongii]PWB99268.1 gamma carbonic anhydrase family protein [Corynebacterium liangguodongii]